MKIASCKASSLNRETGTTWDKLCGQFRNRNFSGFLLGMAFYDTYGGFHHAKT
jgi:hypothetical protein